MGTRDELGAADVSDAQLAAMVADLLHEDSVELLDSRVDPVDYDLPAITTGGRWWVSGHVAAQAERAPFRFFVKQVQSWERHPFFEFVPEEFREMAVATVPWKTEAQVYRSDLATRLRPTGSPCLGRSVCSTSMPRRPAIWLEEVPGAAGPRGTALATSGRRTCSAGSPAARTWRRWPTLRDVDWKLSTYVEGRVNVQVAPMLLGDDIWQHPLTRGLRRGAARPAARQRPARGECAGRRGRCAALRVLSHGDACPNNLLAGERDDELVMIDFGFWGGAPVGFDLSQLLVGDIQIGNRAADDLAELDEAIVAAYVAGLRAEGCEIPEEQVRRAHALCLLIMTGLSTVPFDLFEGPITPETQRIAADRANWPATPSTCSRAQRASER